MSRRPSPEPFAALQPTSRDAAFEVVNAPNNIESHGERGAQRDGQVEVLLCCLFLFGLKTPG